MEVINVLEKVGKIVQYGGRLDLDIWIDFMPAGNIPFHFPAQNPRIYLIGEASYDRTLGIDLAY